MSSSPPPVSSSHTIARLLLKNYPHTGPATSTSSGNMSPILENNSLPSHHPLFSARSALAATATKKQSCDEETTTSSNHSQQHLNRGTASDASSREQQHNSPSNQQQQRQSESKSPNSFSDVLLPRIASPNSNHKQTRHDKSPSIKSVDAAPLTTTNSSSLPSSSSSPLPSPPSSNIRITTSSNSNSADLSQNLQSSQNSPKLKRKYSPSQHLPRKRKNPPSLISTSANSGVNGTSGDNVSPFSKTLLSKVEILSETSDLSASAIKPSAAPVSSSCEPLSSSSPLPPTNNSIAPSFPRLLFHLLEDSHKEGKEAIVSFTESGQAFRIHDPEAFMRDMVPRYFRQKHLSSFKRQLSMYGFDRIPRGPEEGAYAHHLFRQGCPDLSDQIKRVKSSGTKAARRPTVWEPDFSSYQFKDAPQPPPPAGGESGTGESVSSSGAATNP